MENKQSLQRIALNFYEDRTEKNFTTLYHRLKPGISVYLRDMLPDNSDREEVLATTFAKVWSKIDQYDPYWNFSTWAYRIARNEALLFFRGKRKTYSYESMKEMGIDMDSKLHSFANNDFVDDEETSLCDKLHEVVISEITNLPEIYKNVLVLREMEKKKYDEIAESLGWKVNTVKTRIHKARKLVRDRVIKSQPNLLKKYQESL